MAHFPGSMRFDDSLSTLFDDEEQELLNKQFDGEIEAKSNNNNNNKTIQWRKQLPRSHVYRPLQTRFQRLVQLSDVLNTAVWKMCLMSVDPRGRMLFIASKHQILCFDISPVDDSLLNPTKPQKILDPFPLDGAPRGARALFSRDEINQIRAGYLGNEPVLMSVHDSGNVRVFFIDNLDRAPIAVSNNGESTWSLACCCKGTSDKKRYLAVGANNHCVTFWNLGINGEGDNNDGDHSSTNDTSHRTTIRSNKIILRGHDHNIPAVDFDPQGNFIASASIDRTVRIWDTKQAKEVARKKLCAEWCWGVRWIEPECIKVIPESNTNAWLAIKKRLGRGEYSVNYMSDDNLEEEEEEQEEEQEEQEEEEEEEEGQEEHDEATEEEEEEEEVGEWTEDSSHGDGSSGTDVEDDDERTSGDENSMQEQMQGSRQRSNIAEDAQITATAAPLQQPAGPSLSTTSASNGVSPLAKKEIVAMSNFLLCTTKHHVFLLDNHMHIQASIYINNFHGRRNLPSWHTGLNRLSLLEFIPELSVVVVASQVDTQVLLLRVVRNEDGTRYALVPEATFPPRSLHIGPIIGISVAKARQQSPAASPSSGAAAMAALNVSYNIYILTMDKNLFTYEVHRDMDTDSLDYSRVLL